jgi:enoyl-CoA hydratase/carnithine racemase
MSVSTVNDHVPLVLIRRQADVVHLVLNQPARYNVLSSSLLQALDDALVAVAADPSVRVVVLAAQGKAFCAGHDLRELRQHDTDAFRTDLFRLLTRVCSRLRQLPQPVVARVHGLATAGGCQLLLSCDLAIAARSARLGMSGIRLGLYCATPAVALSRQVPLKHAFEALATGDFLDADQAAAYGWVNHAVPDNELDARVEQLVQRLRAQPALALAAGKQLFYRQLQTGIDAAYQMAIPVMAGCFADPETQSRVDAFLA